MKALIGQIEAIIHRDVGRGMDAVFRATRGGLWEAASALGASAAPRIGLITGFFVPNGNPPSAETDGPAGAALMALGFIGAGLSCRLATDTICQSACRVALDAAGAGVVPIDAVAPGESVDALIDLWRHHGIDWVIAIERCGPAADGVLRNMRGADISTFAAPLDRLFSAGPWQTIAIGDGGNEIGMGSIPWHELHRRLNGPGTARVPCRIATDWTIIAGVSNWGGQALAAATLLLKNKADAARDWTTHQQLQLLRLLVTNGPAVDGMTRLQEPTVDGLPFLTYIQPWEGLRRLMGLHN